MIDRDAQRGQTAEIIDRDKGGVAFARQVNERRAPRFSFSLQEMNWARACAADAFVKDSGVAEETVWRGNVSQWKNFGFFVLQFIIGLAIIAAFLSLRRSSAGQNFSPYILLLLAVPIFIAAKRYLQTKCTIYEITTERLKTTDGVLNKVTDTLEFYRIKDIERRQPFLYRLCGIENVQLNTSDASSPLVIIQAIPREAGLADVIRNHVETVRQQKGVREIDVE